MDDSFISFGPYELRPSERLLLEGGRQVRLGGRALDILIALVERAGELVEKDALIAIVWPRSIVEENSLRVHVAALRKVLGDGHEGTRFIINQPGRGYCFAYPIVRRVRAPVEAMPAAIQTGMPRPPARLTRVVGRVEAIAMLAAQLPRRRLVTVVGPGGVGKTTVSVALLEATAPDYSNGVAFVDLAPIETGALVLLAVAVGLGMSNVTGHALPTIAEYLRDKQVLLVFDNCEHLADDVVPLIEHLLKAAPRLHVVATSREPLRAEGEWVYRLPALLVPQASQTLSAEKALSFSAVELFVERATAKQDQFELTNDHALLVAGICRRLDGNPLAIELAAARIDAFGIKGLAEQLGEGLLLLTRGRRTAAARHQTLSALLDWSYSLLSAGERMALRRLAIFKGRFTIDAATQLSAASAEEGMTVRDAMDRLLALTEKSLFVSDTTGEVVYFHLLELTRAYALEKLTESGERTAVERRHAEFLLSLFRRAAEEWPLLGWNEWIGKYGWALDDVRAALAWAFSPRGDALIGVRLTADLWTLWLVLDPFDASAAPERGLRALDAMAEKHPELEFRLTLAVAAMHGHRPDPTSDVADKAHQRALELAVLSGSPQNEAEVLTGLVGATLAKGAYAQAADLIDRLNQVAHQTRDGTTQLVADRVSAQALHFAGQHASATALAQRVLEHSLARAPLRSVASGVDHGVSMRIMLSRILWLQGFADQADRMVRDTIVIAQRSRAYEMCQVLSLAACPLALWRGDLVRSRDLIESFKIESAKHANDGMWLPASANIPWWLVLRADKPRLTINQLHLDHLLTADASLITEDAVKRAIDLPHWASPEIIRAWGETLILQGGKRNQTTARSLFEQALALARDQGALAWELRAATSLARLLWTQGEPEKAHATLHPVHMHFSEGFATLDLQRSAALLESLVKGLRPEQLDEAGTSKES